jgi:hypothetical protein
VERRKCEFFEFVGKGTFDEQGREKVSISAVSPVKTTVDPS